MPMKPIIKKSSQGSTLVITVVISALIGSVLGSYLVLISARNQSAMRALAWNSAIPVLEAGIEEALTHLNDDSSNPRANAWNITQVDGHKAYWKKGDLPDGSYFYVTNLNIASTQPLIYSAGYVPSPLKDHEFISRLVKVTTTNPPSVFPRAIAANGLVKLSGAAIVDGYNSAFPYSPTNRIANGGIATNSKETPAISVGSQAHLYGTAVTGAGGTVYVVPGGSLGDLSQISGIQDSTWTNNDMNVFFQDNSPPERTVPISQVRGQTNILTSGSYTMPSFSSGDRTEPLLVKGDCTLWVTGNFTVGGNAKNAGYVYIEPQAHLKLYVGGAANISGGGIVNGAGSPANFSYFGLPTNKILRYSGTADFVGTINAPQADFVIGGGASVYGAIICNSFTAGGGSSVHYDQGLGGGGILLVTSWKEM